MCVRWIKNVIHLIFQCNATVLGMRCAMQLCECLFDEIVIIIDWNSGNSSSAMVVNRCSPMSGRVQSARVCLFQLSVVCCLCLPLTIMSSSCCIICRTTSITHPSKNQVN